MFQFGNRAGQVVDSRPQFDPDDLIELGDFLGVGIWEMNVCPRLVKHLLSEVWVKL